MSTPAAIPAAAVPDLQTSPWPTFWIASIAVLLVSIDTTVLYAAFGALRQGFPVASPADTAPSSSSRTSSLLVIYCTASSRSCHTGPSGKRYRARLAGKISAPKPGRIGA